MEPCSPRSATKPAHNSTLKSPRFKPPVSLTGLPSPPLSLAGDDLIGSSRLNGASALPPLVPTNGAASPRCAPDSGFALRPVAFPLRLDRDCPVAQLDNWPLTSSPSSGSPRYDHTSAPPSTSRSPLSPRVRKHHARHKVFDDCKSKPLLLQELDAFVTTQLQVIGPSESARPEIEEQSATSGSRVSPNLQRLGVFREVFSRVIESFSVYAPLLARVKAEYEATIQHLIVKCQLLPQLHSELQSLEAQCLQELSIHQLETKMTYRALKQQLKLTQAQLTACAAEKAHLLDDLNALRDQHHRLEQRNAEMHLSNHALVNGMKHHDDTLRHIHERSREEGSALQQMALKYHRACDEIAELKRTVAALEDKVGGVHVAADKATIALLTNDLQDLHSKLVRMSSAGHAPSSSQQQEANDAFEHQQVLLLKVLEANGAASSLPELAEMVAVYSSGGASSTPLTTNVKPMVARMGSTVTSSAPLALTKPNRQSVAPADFAFAVDRVVAALTAKISRFHQQRQQLVAHAASSSSASSATFLTEPADITAFVSANAQILAPLVSPTDYLQARGVGVDVPAYLRYEGVVRNLYFDRKRVEVLIVKVWSHKDDLDGKTKRQPSSSSAVSLADAFSLYLQRCFPSSRHDQVECAYNTMTAVDRFARASSDCRLFSLVLDGHLPDDSRVDQTKDLLALHDALATIHRDLRTQSDQSRDRTVGLPLAEVIQALRRQYPWKSDAQLSTLHRALLLDLHGSRAHVDYTALLSQIDETQSHARVPRRALGKPYGTSQFVECWKTQYMDDLLGFRRHLQLRVQAACMISPTVVDAATDHSTSSLDSAGGGMVAVRLLRDCLQKCDVAKPVQEINRLLSVTTGLTMDQILTNDALMVSAAQFIAKLPTLLVKPSGKYGDGERAKCNTVVFETAATANV